ncbi:MAG: hypothetical protein IPM42_19875 [Saprospiraceae bacterium]|nr:hypothetical protein [Saprospiraceae bacterium]
MNEVFNYIIWCIIILSVLLAGLTIIRFKSFTGYLKYYGLWIIVGTFMEVFSKFLADNGYSNLFLFHINAIIEFSLVVLIFDALLKNLGDKGIVYFLFPGILIILINSLFIQEIDTFNSYTLTLISLWSILTSIYYFFRLSDVVMSLDKKLFKIIIVGSILILHSSALIPILLSNYLLNMNLNTQMIVWILRGCTTIVVKVIIFYTLLSYMYSDEIKV